jgi:hypothetical protein
MATTEEAFARVGANVKRAIDGSGLSMKESPDARG